MIAHIQPSTTGGTVMAPASKSSMQRACAAALIHKGISIIHNPGKSNDDIAALNVIKALGATVEYNNETITIASKGIHAVTNIINNGESGLGIRMFTPLVALNAETITIQGEGSLLSRPMDFFDEVLPQLNVQVNSANGKLPLKNKKGPLKPQKHYY